jgi:hypothetical protein
VANQTLLPETSSRANEVPLQRELGKRSAVQRHLLVVSHSKSGTVDCAHGATTRTCTCRRTSPWKERAAKEGRRTRPLKDPKVGLGSVGGGRSPGPVFRSDALVGSRRDSPTSFFGTGYRRVMTNARISLPGIPEKVKNVPARIGRNAGSQSRLVGSGTTAPLAAPHSSSEFDSFVLCSLTHRTGTTVVLRTIGGSVDPAFPPAIAAAPREEETPGRRRLKPVNQ